MPSNENTFLKWHIKSLAILIYLSRTIIEFVISNHKMTTNISYGILYTTKWHGIKIEWRLSFLVFISKHGNFNEPKSV